VCDERGRAAREGRRIIIPAIIKMLRTLVPPCDLEYVVSATILPRVALLEGRVQGRFMEVVGPTRVSVVRSCPVFGVFTRTKDTTTGLVRSHTRCRTGPCRDQDCSPVWSGSV
jgi:hypothetical protein